MSPPTTKGRSRVSRLLRPATALVAAAMTIVLTAGTAAAAQPDHRGRVAFAHAEGRHPSVSVTVLQTATLTTRGTVILTGQLKCRNAGHVRVHMTLHQTVDGYRVRARGRLHIRGDCDRQWHPWVTAVTPWTGRFTAGSARWRAHATAFGQRNHRHASATATVSLSG